MALPFENNWHVTGGSMIKQLSRWMIDGRAFHHLAQSLERRDRRTDRLRVLTYHRVLPSQEHSTSYPGLISTSPDGFAQQVDFLAENYNVVSLDQVLDAITRGSSLPPRAVLLTFDDAYTDFAEHAWPVLCRRRLPVTLFVPTGFPDQPSCCFWWDRIHHACLRTTVAAITGTSLGTLPLNNPQQRAAASAKLNQLFKSLPHGDACELVDQIWDELAPPPLTGDVLGWEALRRLHREGVALAAHTRTHPLLNRLPLPSAVAEATQSHADLCREIGPVPPVLAYPGGGLSTPLIDALRQAFTLAFSTRRGINRISDTDALCLHRINVGRKATVASLRAQLLICAETIYRGWNRKKPAPASPARADLSITPEGGG